MATKYLNYVLVHSRVYMTYGVDADAMFTLTVWHMMGTAPTDPGVLPTLYRLLQSCKFAFSALNMLLDTKLNSAEDHA